MREYDKLAEYLDRQEVNAIRLTFAEVEKIIGGSLPQSAYAHAAWWANSRTEDSHSWAHKWIKAGWEKFALDQNGQWVEFRRAEYYDSDDVRAIEGYLGDHKKLSRTRNRKIAKERRELDNFTCQVCGFLFELEGRFVIDVHHLNPLAMTGEVVTSIGELISLCPTCHRISHLKNPPFEPSEVKALLKYNAE